MKNITRIIVVSLTVLILSGCVGWTKVDNPNLTDPKSKFSIQVPDGWKRFEGGIYSGKILMSANGILLTKMMAYHAAHDEAFKKIEKKSNEKMLPSEVAELYVAELKTDDDLKNIEILDNRPAQLGGNSAFRLHMRHRTEKGLRIDTVAYGFADKSGVFILSFESPKLYYFDKFSPEYEASVKTFKML